MHNLQLSTRLEKLLIEYLSLDTSAADGHNYPHAVSLLKLFLLQIGFETEVVDIPVSVAGGQNRQHLIARRFTSNKLPTLLIYNHIDVVPATYKNAFVPTIKDGKIFARGACDHKGSTVAVLAALEQLQSTQLRFNVVFIATTDEETGQLEQLRFLAKKLHLPKNTLVFDPDTMAGGVSVATLGLYQLEIIVEGKSVHSGVSHMGVNAVEQAASIIDFLKKTEKPRLESQASQFKSFPGTGVDHICSRANINQIHGGVAANVVPDNCSFIVDFRFIPESDVATEVMCIKARLEDFCKKEKIQIKLTEKSFCESYATTHPEVDLLNGLYFELTGESGVYGVLGSTHAAQWCKELELPHFGIGVARGDTGMHSSNEFAYLNDLNSLKQVLVKYLAPQT
jgi:acetylornithine deacetylase/succinyl-diaminopimelate desuccinylase-like protein